MILITDIDGVLASDSWRRYLLPDWNEYHRMSIDDEPNRIMVNLINMVIRDGQSQVIGLTGRPEKWRQLTNTWLLRHDIMLDDIIMRPDDDFKSSPEFKLEALRGFYTPASTLIIDDREDVATALRGAGYTVLTI